VEEQAEFKKMRKNQTKASRNFIFYICAFNYKDGKGMAL